MWITHWGRITHVCLRKLTVIGSDNGLLPGRCQAIIWTNAGLLLIEPIGTNFCEILIEMYTFSVMKMYLKMSSGKWRPFCFGLNMLIVQEHKPTDNQVFTLIAVWEHPSGSYAQGASNTEKISSHFISRRTQDDVFDITKIKYFVQFYWYRHCRHGPSSISPCIETVLAWRSPSSELTSLHSDAHKTKPVWPALADTSPARYIV